VDSKFEVPRVPVPHQHWFRPPFHSHLPPSSIVAPRRVQSPDILIPRAAPLSLSLPPHRANCKGHSKAACTSRRETSAPYRSLSTGRPKIISASNFEHLYLTLKSAGGNPVAHILVWKRISRSSTAHPIAALVHHLLDTSYQSLYRGPLC
jgi:hypothetical protein